MLQAGAFISASSRCGSLVVWGSPVELAFLVVWCGPAGARLLSKCGTQQQCGLIAAADPVLVM
jgi:hypothetical protein